MTVCANVDAVVSHCFEDESCIGWGKLVQTFLYHMISIQVLNQINDLVAESIDDSCDLVFSAHKFDHLLQCAGSMLVESDADKFMRGIFDQDGAFVIVAELEELLTEIVAKWVGHKFNDVLIRFQPDHVHLIRVAVLQLLLQEAAAMLVLAQSIDLATKTFEGSIGIFLHGC